MGVKEAMNILRDHYEDVPELQSIYSPAANKVCTICSHPGGVGDGCATAASTVTVLKKDVPKELAFTYWGSMAPPCCSIFRPYYNIDFIPDDLQHAHALTGRRISGGDSLNWRDTSLLIMRNSRRR